jgi:hypothetical protein
MGICIKVLFLKMTTYVQKQEDEERRPVIARFFFNCVCLSHWPPFCLNIVLMLFYSGL